MCSLEALGFCPTISLTHSSISTTPIPMSVSEFIIYPSKEAITGPPLAPLLLDFPSQTKFWGYTSWLAWVSVCKSGGTLLLIQEDIIWFYSFNTLFKLILLFYQYIYKNQILKILSLIYNINYDHSLFLFTILNFKVTFPLTVLDLFS